MSCVLVLHDTLAQMRLQIFTPTYIINVREGTQAFENKNSSRVIHSQYVLVEHESDKKHETAKNL